MDTKSFEQKTSQPRKKELRKKTVSCDKVDENLLTWEEMEEENRGLDKVTGKKIS